MPSVIGVFNDRNMAEKAVGELRDKGFSDKISILAKDDERHGKDQGGMRMGNENDITGGTTTGSVLGGAAGLLAGIGALAIPGIGPIVAAGPLAATLTGAVTGGLVGGLVDLGIPEDRSGYYEEKVKEGKILAVIQADEGNADEASRILRDNGASDVEVH